MQPSINTEKLDNLYFPLPSIRPARKYSEKAAGIACLNNLIFCRRANFCNEYQIGYQIVLVDFLMGRRTNWIGYFWIKLVEFGGIWFLKMIQLTSDGPGPVCVFSSQHTNFRINYRITIIFSACVKLGKLWCAWNRVWSASCSCIILRIIMSMHLRM